MTGYSVTTTGREDFSLSHAGPAGFYPQSWLGSEPGQVVYHYEPEVLVSGPSLPERFKLDMPQ